MNEIEQLTHALQNSSNAGCINLFTLNAWDSEYILICHPDMRSKIMFQMPGFVQVITSDWIPKNELVFNPNKLDIQQSGVLFSVKKSKMIQANELRIGNWVSHVFGDLIKVEAIGYNIINMGGPQGNPEFKYLLGIPLTPEILVKIGFENVIEDMPEDGELLSFFNENIEVELTTNILGLYDVEDVRLYEDVIDEEGQLASEECYTVKTQINCVHQLQNLYFALTGKELDFTL